MSYLIDNAQAETSAVTTAEPNANGPQATQNDFVGMVIPFVFIFVVFYFLILRPQQRKYKQHLAMVTAIKRGDNVVTSGGILGKVARVDDDGVVQVEIADGVTVKVMSATISTVLGDPALNDNAKKK